MDTRTDTTAVSENPKAEALTLVIHKYPPKLHPVKLIDRNDELLVIHSKRPKRKPNSRKRRPSSSQYRSKIKTSSGTSSNFGGFKDFTSSDFRPSSSSRFPPFPTKNFGEPPRASNKYKFGPNPSFEGYSYNPPQGPVKKSKRPSSRQPTPIYGPPPNFNQFESSYNKDLPSSLQSLQQQQSSFPSYSIDSVEASNNNYFGSSSDRFPQPISKFPLESGLTFTAPKTSYGSPVRTQGSSSSNFQYNPSLLATNLNSNLNQNSNANFPKLPSRYETKDFSTPTRTNPLGGGNPFLNSEYSQLNEVAESQNVQTASNQNRNRFKGFNKFNNFDYDFKVQNSGQKNSSPSEEGYDDENESLDYLFSTRRPFFTTTTTTTTTTEIPLTTKRPKKGSFGKRKRPLKFSQSHTLDTDDLRDAYTESNDFHEVALSSDDFINFDSQREHKRSQDQQYPHEIHSTLKTARKQSSALRSALGEDFEIVSIEKSLEKNPSEVDLRFQRKHDHVLVGSELSFGPDRSEIWNGDFENFPRNHRFS